MKIKFNEKNETKKCIVHDREPPDSSSRHVPKKGHFKRKGVPEKDKNKTNPLQKNKQGTIKNQFMQWKGLKIIRVAWNPTWTESNFFLKAKKKKKKYVTKIEINQENHVKQKKKMFNDYQRLSFKLELNLNTQTRDDFFESKKEK